MFVNALLKNQKDKEYNNEVTQQCIQLQKILYNIDNSNKENE